MRILKFGGKSLETPEKTQKICKFIKNIYKTDKKLIIIVSAIGNTTNNLLKKVKSSCKEKASKRELDVLLSTGETESSAMFAITLNSLGVPAKSFQGWQIQLKTKGDFQNSLIYSINKSVLENCINSNTVAVVSGFQGINQNNEITTLGRGGSDATAAAIGAIFQTNVEIYSDYNGVFAGDPALNNFKKINQLSFLQMKNASLAGAKVIDFHAAKIAEENNISLISKSSNTPNLKGTVINNIESNKIILSTNSNICEVNLTFSSKDKLKLIYKNVYFIINQYKFYNLMLNNQNISFLINEADKQRIINKLSKKLNLLK